MAISFEDNRVGGDANILNRASLTYELDVSIRRNKIVGNLAALNDMDIMRVMSEVDKILPNMEKESDEYEKLRELSEKGRGDKKRLREGMMAHLAEFVNGTLQNVVVQLLIGR